MPVLACGLENYRSTTSKRNIEKESLMKDSVSPSEGFYQQMTHKISSQWLASIKINRMCSTEYSCDCNTDSQSCKAESQLVYKREISEDELHKIFSSQWQGRQSSQQKWKEQKPRDGNKCLFG